MEPPVTWLCNWNRVLRLLPFSNKKNQLHALHLHRPAFFCRLSTLQAINNQLHFEKHTLVQMRQSSENVTRKGKFSMDVIVPPRHVSRNGETGRQKQFGHATYSETWQTCGLIGARIRTA